MFQRHSGILVILNVKQFSAIHSCRTLALVFLLFSTPETSIAFTPLDWNLMEGILSTKYIDRLPLDYNTKPLIQNEWQFNAHPLALSVGVVIGAGYNEANDLLAGLQANHPQLAQFLVDVVHGQHNSDLITLLGFFLSHSDEAVYFNTHVLVNTHTSWAEQSISMSRLVALMQFIQGNNQSISIFRLLQTAPMLAQFFADRGDARHDSKIPLIDQLLNFPELVYFLDKLMIVQNHKAGTTISNAHQIMKNLRVTPLSGRRNHSGY